MSILCVGRAGGGAPLWQVAIVRLSNEVMRKIQTKKLNFELMQALAVGCPSCGIT